MPTETAWALAYSPFHPRSHLADGPGEPFLGYRRVHGELTTLGVKVASSMVWEILKQEGLAGPGTLASLHHGGSIGDPDRVVNMLVGDTQRIEVYAERGFAIPQPIPGEVRHAYQRLIDRGYTTRLVA